MAGASPATAAALSSGETVAQAEPLGARCSARIARDERDREPLLTGHERRQQADRPRADDDGALAGLRMRAAERVERDGGRLDQRARAIVHGFREGEEHARVDDHALGIGARPPGPEPHAVGDGRAAHLLGAGATRGALAALRERQHHTRSPGAQPVTPSPTAPIDPAISWPGTVPAGNSAGMSRKCRSEPQIPQ